MRVLVTGATGFLGTWVTDALVQSGCNVRALARQNRRTTGLEHLNVEVVRGDVTVPESVSSAMADCEAVVHCAGIVSLNPRDRHDMQMVNVEGTRAVLQAAALRGAKVIHTSTIATIGPTREPLALAEDAPAHALPFDYPYAASKRESESLALDYARRGLDVVVLNPGVLLGPGDLKFTSTQFVLRYLRRELWTHLGGGASFGDVRDVAAAYVPALERGRRGERYVLAGQNHTYQELQEELRRVTGLHRSMPMPRPLAEWYALWSQAASALARHPFEEFNLSVVRWGSLFNYCSAHKAETQLGYRIRDFTATVTDTVFDHLQRGAAQPTTVELQTLLGRTVQTQSA
jgi:dihydroflavonol-4-reductase